ncbi:MAG: hypothetical protein KatS3mg055_2798 [Chloroflexus sp.]|nr:MAG: hypothetical protein KatS3mg055_2798 [Chloroflexus sp.]
MKAAEQSLAARRRWRGPDLSATYTPVSCHRLSRSTPPPRNAAELDCSPAQPFTRQSRERPIQEHLSLVSINQLLGEDLKDGNRASQTFRAFISQPTWQYENFEAWIPEAMAQRLLKHLQDSVVALGQHLGFQVEFGRYSPSKEGKRFDGIWKKATGEHIVLEVKSGTRGGACCGRR